MSTNTIYLITGANRGIGLGLTAALLKHENTTVIATIRSESSKKDELNALRIAANSSLIVLPLSSTSDTDATDLVSTIQKAPYNISRIDTVIANAGSGTSFHSAATTSLDSLRSDFEINTLGPVKLFQATASLLARSATPRFILISSSLGSIGDMEGNVPSLSYGVSKAGANYVVRKIHFEHEHIVALAIHPGWVKTENGQNFADAMGVQEPPMDMDASVGGIINQIQNVTRIAGSGTFVSYNGETLQW